MTREYDKIKDEMAEESYNEAIKICVLCEPDNKKAMGLCKKHKKIQKEVSNEKTK